MRHPRPHASASRWHDCWQACAAGASVVVRRQVVMQALKLSVQLGASPAPVIPLEA
jgi:hypothetical protein